MSLKILNKNQHKARHFQYNHPTFGTDKNPKPPSAWESSVYYWWFEYLKRNTAYHELLDSNLESEICRDFGDVRNKTFKEWWREDDRAIKLFAEPIKSSVRILDDGEVVEHNTMFLNISFPLDLPKEHLRKKFDEYLSKLHKGKSGVQNSKSSQARYKFSAQPNIDSLKRDLLVYDIHLQHPDIPLIEACKDLKWVNYPKASLKKESTSLYSDQKATENFKLKRQLKRAQIAIKATTYGHFPKIPLRAKSITD
jgi:hypothetical protein